MEHKNIVKMLSGSLTNVKRHNLGKKCHNITKKCHAMTSCGFENNKKTQGQSVGYVKVMFFAHPLMKGVA